MANSYTNLPPKDKDQLDKTIEKLTTSNYEEEFQFNVGEYDAAIGFFVKRGFTRTAAETTAYIILQQASSTLDLLQVLLDQPVQALFLAVQPIMVLSVSTVLEALHSKIVVS